MMSVLVAVSVAHDLWSQWLKALRDPLASMSFVEFVDDGFEFIDRGMERGMVIKRRHVFPDGVVGEIRIHPEERKILLWGPGESVFMEIGPIPQRETEEIYHHNAADDTFTGADPFAAATRAIARST